MSQGDHGFREGVTTLTFTSLNSLDKILYQLSQIASDGL